MDISNLNPGQHILWLYIGDFNCITKAAEKRGGRMYGKNATYFFDFIQLTGLIDLGYQRDYFTWLNRQKDQSNIQCRLD